MITMVMDSKYREQHPCPSLIKPTRLLRMNGNDTEVTSGQKYGHSRRPQTPRERLQWLRGWQHQQEEEEARSCAPPPPRQQLSNIITATKATVDDGAPWMSTPTRPSPTGLVPIRTLPGPVSSCCASRAACDTATNKGGSNTGPHRPRPGPPPSLRPPPSSVVGRGAKKKTRPPPPSAATQTLNAT